jgi:hypothetical protein
MFVLDARRKFARPGRSAAYGEKSDASTPTLSSTSWLRLIAVVEARCAEGRRPIRQWTKGGWAGDRVWPLRSRTA